MSEENKTTKTEALASSDLLCPWLIPVMEAVKEGRKVSIIKGRRRDFMAPATALHAISELQSEPSDD